MSDEVPECSVVRWVVTRQAILEGFKREVVSLMIHYQMFFVETELKIMVLGVTVELGVDILCVNRLKHQTR